MIGLFFCEIGMRGMCLKQLEINLVNIHCIGRFTYISNNCKSIVTTFIALEDRFISNKYCKHEGKY